MRTRSFHVTALLILAAAALCGQSSVDPIYWSVSPPDCSTLNETPIQIEEPSTKTTLGYSCYVAGTFVWLAAGGIWSTAIRVAAPASGAIGVDYSFYDQTGNNQNLDTTGSITNSGYELAFSLYANQPAEIDLLGASADAGTGYSNTATGSVYTIFLCPDAKTCINVLPQLLYSALPTYPWSLSVPITWDTATYTQWSAVGVEDGAANRISLVVDNEDTSTATFKIYVYDSTGKPVGSGTTPPIPPGLNYGGGAYGPGGTYAALLSDLVPGLPVDVFKILVDGGSIYSAVEMLQVSGSSATTLQVAYDSAPATAGAGIASRPDVRTARISSKPRPVFRALPKKRIQ
jgi:hypothetical protein